MENSMVELSKEEILEMLDAEAGKNQVWKPQEDNIFWRIDAFGNPVLDKWTGHSAHLTFYKIGNCYRTEVDAKKDRDKWMSFYASDEVLDWEE